MTSLTDKMEGLRRKEGKAQPLLTAYNAGIDACIRLAQAEEAVVGDWEAEYRDMRRNACVPGDTYRVWLDKEVTFITSLLAAKDWERAEELYWLGLDKYL